MNAEKMRKKAIIEYAVRELNNIIISARTEKMNLSTSKSYMYSMQLYETDKLDAISILNGKMEVVISTPFAIDMVNHVGIASDKDPASYVAIDIDTVLGWLEQIQKND